MLAVAGYGVLVHTDPQHYWAQIDTAVYRDGGIAVRNQPAMLYALRLGPAKLPFIYTPFAALLCAAGSGASFATWQFGLTVLAIALMRTEQRRGQPFTPGNGQLLQQRHQFQRLVNRSRNHGAPPPDLPVVPG